MNNEEKILALLEQMIEKQDQMVARQDKTDAAIADLREEMNSMHEEMNRGQLEICLAGYCSDREACQAARKRVSQRQLSFSPPPTPSGGFFHAPRGTSSSPAICALTERGIESPLYRSLIEIAPRNIFKIAR